MCKRFSLIETCRGITINLASHKGLTKSLCRPSDLTHAILDVTACKFFEGVAFLLLGMVYPVVSMNDENMIY